MVNGDAMLKSLTDQMNESKQQFEDVNNAIESLANQYEEKITQLQSRREQIRGEYTALYNLYLKYAPKEETEVKKEAESKQVKVEDDKSKPAKAAKKVQKESTLTDEEVAKLKDKLATKSANNKVREEDIPEYLKSEYNK